MDAQHPYNCIIQDGKINWLEVFRLYQARTCTGIDFFDSVQSILRQELPKIGFDEFKAKMKQISRDPTNMFRKFTLEEAYEDMKKHNCTTLCQYVSEYCNIPGGMKICMRWAFHIAGQRRAAKEEATPITQKQSADECRIYDLSATGGKEFIDIGHGGGIEIVHGTLRIIVDSEDPIAGTARLLKLLGKNGEA